MKKLLSLIAVITFVALLGTTLFGCKSKDDASDGAVGLPNTVEEAQNRMLAAGYTIEESYTAEGIAALAEEYAAEDFAVPTELLQIEGALGALFAKKNVDPEKTEYLRAILFESTAKANAYYTKALSADFEANYTQKGKWIFGGTDDAVKVFSNGKQTAKDQYVDPTQIQEYLTESRRSECISDTQSIAQAIVNFLSDDTDEELGEYLPSHCNYFHSNLTWQDNLDHKRKEEIASGSWSLIYFNSYFRATIAIEEGVVSVGEPIKVK